jgi:hypothetical protein
MIEMRTWPLEETRSPDRPCFWVTETTLVDGRVLQSRSRHGAPNELARTLVDAGLPDDEVQTYNQHGVKALHYRSLHEMAKRTYREGAGRPLQRARWEPRPEGISFTPRNAQNRGESDPEVPK